MELIRNKEAKTLFGCDFVVKLPENNKNEKIKLLQITDMQIIDAEQRRTADRLRKDEINAWSPEKIEENFANHLKSLVTQSKPDLIFITGDMVYGSFDDSGRVFEWFRNFMDSFCIPWACVFGNHDNESKKGVQWQCNMLENTRYGMFKRGNVSGNGNYTVGICVGNEIVRVLHMLDSHGCLTPAGIYPDQLELVKENAKLINKMHNKNVPGFIGMHFPTEEYRTAELFKGYMTEERETYIIGVDVDAKDDDFGVKSQNFKKVIPVCVPGFLKIVKECNIQAVFAGHYHSVNTCITYEGVKWVQGLKTGQYDYHNPGQLGGTLIILENEKFSVSHVPALVNYAPFPGTSVIFKGFFADDV